MRSGHFCEGRQGAKSKIRKETSFGDKAAAALAKSHSETSLGDKAAAKSEIMKGDKLGRQGGSGSQERNQEGRQAAGSGSQERKQEGRQASETRRQLAKSEIMKGDKLGRQGGSGSQERNHKGRPGGSGNQFPQSVTQPLRSKNPYSFQLSGEKRLKTKLATAEKEVRIVFFYRSKPIKVRVSPLHWRPAVIGHAKLTL